MTKKIFCLVVVATMLCSVFAVSTSASIATSKTYAEADFTRPADQIDNADWKPQDWTITGVSGKAETYDQGIFHVHPDGYVELSRAGYENGTAKLESKALSLPSDFTLMFDVKYSVISGYEGTMSILCSLNGFKQSLSVNGAVSYINEETGAAANGATGAHVADKWYSYIYQVKGDRMSVYKKAEDEDAFSLKLDNVKMDVRSGNIIYAYSTSPTGHICLDNIKVFAGTYMTDADISFNDEKTQITGTMNVTCADVAPLDGTTAPVISVMTVYDAKGKIVDLVFNNEELKFNNENTFTATITLADGEYNDLIGGTVEFYLWDSLSGLTPQTKAYIKPIKK